MKTLSKNALDRLAREFLAETALQPDFGDHPSGEAWSEHIRSVQRWLHQHPEVSQPGRRCDRRPTPLFLAAYRAEFARQELERAEEAYRAALAAAKVE